MGNLHRLAVEDIRNFVLGGNALVTLESGKTGVRYTFKVRKPDEDKPYFVSMLTGSDNDSDYNYIGYFKDVIRIVS